MKVAHLPEPAEERVVFRDGLGVREARDSGTGEVVEWFHLDPAFAAVDTPLRDRVGRLAKFQHVKFARILSLEAAARDRGPILISSHVPGIRLAEVLEMAGHGLITFDPGAGLQIVREVLGALAVLHDSRNVAHGALGPERVVITASGRSVVVEHVLAHALDRLQRPRHQLWREWRVPTPPAAGPVRFDMHTDLAQAGILALAVLLGRPLDEDEYPHRLRGLLPLVQDRLGRSPASAAAADVVAFLERLAPVDSRRAFKTVREAQQAFEALVAGNATAMGVTLTRVKAVVAAVASMNVGGSIPLPTADGGAPAAARSPAAIVGSVPALVWPTTLDVTTEASGVLASAADADADIDIAALLALEAELEGGTPPARFPVDALVAPSHAESNPATADVPSESTEPAPHEPADLTVLARQRLDLERQFADLVAAVAPAADTEQLPPPGRSESLVDDRVLWSSMPSDHRDGQSGPAVAAPEASYPAWLDDSPTALSADGDAGLELSMPWADTGLVPPVDDMPSSGQIEACTAAAAVADAQPEADVAPDAAPEPLLLHAQPEDARTEWWREALPWRDVDQVTPQDDLATVHRDPAPETAPPVPDLVSADAQIEPETPDVLPLAIGEQIVEEPSSTAAETTWAGDPLADWLAVSVADRSPADHEHDWRRTEIESEPVDSTPADADRAWSCDSAESATLLSAETLEASAPPVPDLVSTGAQIEAETPDVLPLTMGEQIVDEPSSTMAETSWAGDPPADWLAVSVADGSPADDQRDWHTAWAGAEPVDSTPADADRPFACESAESVAILSAATLEASAFPPDASIELAPSRLTPAEPDTPAMAEAEDHVGDSGVLEAAPAPVECAVACTDDEPDQLSAASPVVKDSDAPHVSAPSAPEPHVEEGSGAEPSADGVPDDDPVPADTPSLADPVPEVVIVDDEHDRDAWDHLPSELPADAGPLTTTPIADETSDPVAPASRRKRRRTRRKKGAPVEVVPAAVVALPEVPVHVPSAVMATMALSLSPMDHEPACADDAAGASRGVRQVSLLDRPVPVWTPPGAVGSSSSPQGHAETIDVTAVQPTPEKAVTVGGAPPAAPIDAGDALATVTAPVAAFTGDAVPAPSGPRQIAGPQGVLAVIGADTFRPFEQEIRAVGMPDLDDRQPRAPRATLVSVGDAIGTSAAATVRFPLDSWSASTESPAAGRGINWRRLLAASVLVALFQGAAFAAWWWVQPGARGTLVVQTDKAGVEVLLDDKVVGRTPFREDIVPGRHKLKLREGRHVREMAVEISVGVVTTQAIDWPASGAAKGNLQVTSNPAGAEIFVKGRSRGKAPQLLEDMPAGDQVLMLRGEAGTVTVTATVLSGETTPLEVKIFAGWIQVDAAVELNLLLNGREKIGSSMDGQILLPPGVHRVQAVNDSLGIRQWLTMAVEPGAVQRVPFIVEPGTLTLRDEAEIFIDGTSVGTTPGTIAIAPGTHEIAIRHPDGSERRQAMTVRAGQRVEF